MTKTYVHKKYYLFDDENQSWVALRMSWDKDRFFIRSVQVTDKDGSKHTPKIVSSDVGIEYVEIPL